MRIPDLNGDWNALVFGKLAISPSNRSVTWRGEVVDLEIAEFNLLLILARSSGTILRRNEILKKLNDMEFNGMANTPRCRNFEATAILRRHIARTRQDQDHMGIRLSVQPILVGLNLHRVTSIDSRSQQYVSTADRRNAFLTHCENTNPVVQTLPVAPLTWCGGCVIKRTSSSRSAETSRRCCARVSATYSRRFSSSSRANRPSII